LVWNASPGATRYYLYQNGVRLNISDLDTTAVILRNRAPNTNFTFTVRAANANGTSGHSAQFTVRTLPGAAPAAPTNLRLRDADDALTDTQIRLVWNASAGATRYYVYQSGSRLGSVTNAAAIFRNLTPNTSFTFTVRAANASGVSGHSAPLTVRTLASGTTLEVSTNRIFVPANGNSHPVTVTSNAIWSITRSHEWITPSVNGGNNTGTFNVSVDPNDEPSERTGTITVIAGIFRRVIEVVQAGRESANQLVTAQNLRDFGWTANLTNEYISRLNSALTQYGITDRRSLRLFMATCGHESGKGRLRLEGLPLLPWVQYGVHERGAGYIQLTWRATHLEFLATVNDSFTGLNTAEHIAANYPWEASTWFWTRIGSNMRSNISSSPDTLNRFILTNGDSLRVFLLTQYAVNGWGIVEGAEAPTHAAAQAILNGTTFRINNNTLSVDGFGSFRLPIGWADRYNNYNQAMRIF